MAGRKQSRARAKKRRPLHQATSRTWDIQLLQRHSAFKIRTAALKKLAQKILAELDASALPPAVGELSILLTTDVEIKDLNRDYRGKDKATDVLSFSQLESEYAHLSGSLGDIAISLDRTKAQAKRHRVTFEDELLRLLIHGILHLFGYDHEKVPKREAEKMRRLERKIRVALRDDAEGLLV